MPEFQVNTYVTKYLTISSEQMSRPIPDLVNTLIGKALCTKLPEHMKSFIDAHLHA